MCSFLASARSPLLRLPGGWQPGPLVADLAEEPPLVPEPEPDPESESEPEPEAPPPEPQDPLDVIEAQLECRCVL